VDPGPITRIETLRHPAHRHLLHVAVETADGAAGLGETYFAPGAVEAYVHEELAARVLALEDASPALVRGACAGGINTSRRPGGPISVETAAASALDIAAWDLHARRCGARLCDVLSVAARAAVPLYNTCCDPDHDWAVGGPAGPHRDFTDSLERPAELARELAGEGFAAMKVWPFAPGRDVDEDLARVAAAASATALPVAVDLGAAYAFEEAMALVGALDGLGLAWIEDPLAAPDAADLGRLARHMRTPLCAGESFAGADAVVRLIREGGVAIVHRDLSWGGGVSAAVEAARAADARARPVTFHDCTGPVAWAASVHAAAAVANTLHVECARTFVRGAYASIVDGVPPIVGGTAAPLGPGHGCTLTSGYRGGAASRVTDAV
jgi:L-alanine-DL-glutamate epimerase-like enolase superfamily enzyme